jgi:CRISPR/Cas system type I-B associated protein Csh2 (Cas7 group RAMP superfamily)
VSAVVSPAISEEIARLAKAAKVSRSTMLRRLLEERLTQRADERLTETYDKVEQRLRRIESRFAAFMAKNVRLTAQNLYLDWYYLREFTKLSNEELKKLNEAAVEYAGQQLKQAKDEPSSEDVV